MVNEDIDWEMIQDLRRLFCEDAASSQRKSDYWRDDDERLYAYHHTLAQRIGWKWDSVLRELSVKGWPRDFDRILDIGCGTGIQTLKVLRWLKLHEKKTPEITLIDQSQAAAVFAMKEIKSEFPDVKIRMVHSLSEVREPGLILLSHLLNELDDVFMTKLVEHISLADGFIWVEAGTYKISRSLSTIRDQLRNTHVFDAPCPHNSDCPILASEKDWCHFFAEPPPEAFTTKFWSEFARNCKVDLRSLPTSFIAARKSVGETNESSPHRRLLGRPKFLKAETRVQVCAIGGLEEVVIEKKKNKQLVKQLKKNCFRVELP